MPADELHLVLPSVLDRLIDVAEGDAGGRVGYSLAQMIEAVGRDLEDLLNTRQPRPVVPDDFVELVNSIATYGIPELTSLNAITPQQREAIGRVLEQAVMRFEPRLRSVQARLTEGASQADRKIHFLLRARLVVEPATEVAFETVLELATGYASVQSRQV
jgi:type VI secretion system protein ImpF